MAKRATGYLKQEDFSAELQSFRDYVTKDNSEKSKAHLLYPLFLRLYKDKFKIENDVHGADIYVEGKLIVESKSTADQWLEGFYQALHYHRRYGLVYNTIMVVAHQFVGIWKLNKIPEYATVMARSTLPILAPSQVGPENAKKTSAANKKAIADSAFYLLTPKDLSPQLYSEVRSLTFESYEIKKILANLDSDRLQINTHNFIDNIELIKPFFRSPIEAVHAFYSIIPYWDITSKASTDEYGNLRVFGFNQNRFSDEVIAAPGKLPELVKFIESHYIFTNEGSGLTVDYYFSRFDEVMARMDKGYVAQHGIFFTDANLSKFALWFAAKHFPGDINSDYVVFDPAGGSGNLVSSWRGKLKHKIISELQPDLLRIIERRMRADPFHIEHGFTIIPRTSTGEGLNFLDRPAEVYLKTLQEELARSNVKLDKPIAFLLNPPYKNNDQRDETREAHDGLYAIDPGILALSGEDAGRELYLAFLGQIMLMAKANYAQLPKGSPKPIVMVFTPTSWLVPRPTYKSFRRRWDAQFRFHAGFMITSNEFFKLDGRWPLAFTMWVMDEEEDRTNQVELLDLTEFSRKHLAIDWLVDEENVDWQIEHVLKVTRNIDFSHIRPSVQSDHSQSMYDFKRDVTKKERDGGGIVGGLPLRDGRRGNKKTYGIPDSQFIGFMDDTTQVRVKQDSGNRSSIEPNRVWLQLRPSFIDVNLTKVQSGPPDKYGYCAFNIESAKSTFTWYSITKALNGLYPTWANQLDIWAPTIPPEKEAEWNALCFAFVLAENRCVVTKFEANNPVAGAPEVYVDNPMSPNNPNCFWRTTLLPEVEKLPAANPARQLVNAVTELYKFWNREYCKGQVLQEVGLKNEPYFRYFNYSDFLTKDSGLVQIRKYAELQNNGELLQHFQIIQERTKAVRQAIYTMLVGDFNYFG